ncbi:hypothetical protein [Rubritepida flocculans]|uniref:hypothetical protein n=1 Tax=Rubritepida flocculans TaxID=182403 RepID=UPI0004226569|nr:hypothetical protein [Rubritepida flocculans]
MSAGELFLVFRPRRGAGVTAWWQRLLHPWRAHVLAVLPLSPGQSLAVDHEGARLRVEVMDLPAEQAARGLMWAWEAEALRVPLPPPAPPQARLRGPMTCVEVAKALLGLTGLRVLTPHHLRRAVIARGARPVSPYPAAG